MLLRLIALTLAIFGIYKVMDMTPEEIYVSVLASHNNESVNLRTLQKKTQKQKKRTWLLCTMDDAKKYLRIMHKEELWPTICVSAGFTAMIGVIIAFLCKNYFTVPVFALLGFEIPFVVVKVIGIRSELNLITELETALSQITTSYLRNDDFIAAVEENVSYFNSPVREAFVAFLNRVKNIDSDIIKALNALGATFDITPFTEWVNTVKSCQRNRKLKHSLPLIVDRLSQTREINNRFSGEVFFPIKEFALVSVISLAAVPVFYLAKPALYKEIAVGTIPNLFSAIMYLAIAISLPSVVNITKPLEFKR